MTKIECIIRPNKILEVKDALGNMGINGITITKALGFGAQKGHLDIDNFNKEDTVTLLPETKIEIVVLDEVVDKVIDVIIKATRTGEIGDGKIFTYPIANAIRIRTGELGEKAL